MNFYAILQVLPSASQSQIRESYLALVKELHPDRNAHPGAGKALADVNTAYETLSDPGKRRAYDLKFKVTEFKERVVREFRPIVPPSGPPGSVDLVAVAEQLIGRFMPGVPNALAPLMARKLGEVGIDPRAATAEQLLEAVGWLKPQRKPRSKRRA